MIGVFFQYYIHLLLDLFGFCHMVNVKITSFMSNSLDVLSWCCLVQSYFFCTVIAKILQWILLLPVLKITSTCGRMLCGGQHPPAVGHGTTHQWPVGNWWCSTEFASIQDGFFFIRSIYKMVDWLDDTSIADHLVCCSILDVRVQLNTKTYTAQLSISNNYSCVNSNGSWSLFIVPLCNCEYDSWNPTRNACLGFLHYLIRG